MELTVKTKFNPGQYVWTTYRQKMYCLCVKNMTIKPRVSRVQIIYSLEHPDGEPGKVFYADERYLFATKDELLDNLES